MSALRTARQRKSSWISRWLRQGRCKSQKRCTHSGERGPWGGGRGRAFEQLEDRRLLTAFTAVKDNTLFESSNGSLSNGSGDFLFVGRTLQGTGNLRRAVVAFDLSEIPAGSTVTAASLELSVSRSSRTGNQDVAVHLLNRDWGEGASNAGGLEGRGASAATGDATWLHTSFNTATWSRPGGDFVTAPSAVTNVGGVGARPSWSSAQLVADVQAWVDTPANNFGWILIGNESATSAKQFPSKDNSSANANGTAPILDVTFTPPPQPASLSIAAADAARAEGNAGNTAFTFTVSRGGDTTGTTTANYAVTGSGANPANAADFGGSFPSGTVSFASGQTSQTITINVSGDGVVEPDEGFVVTLSNPAPANTEIVTATANGTIQNDDTLPTVTLGIDNTAIPEASGVATVTATLSAAATVDVTVSLGFTGTATSGVDFTTSANQIVIPAGSASGTATVTAIQDSLDELDEIITIDIIAVTNGVAAPSQQLSVRILDDDEPVMNLQVTSLVATSSGFVVELNRDVDLSTLNLVDTETAGLGPADVLLEGAASGPVPGSLVIGSSPATITFIKTGGPLVADTYTVTLRSATDGLQSSAGFPLDGNGDGTPGDDFSATFPVAPPAANAVTVGVPDFVRGPGQMINLPADTTDGIPIVLSETGGVRGVGLRIDYDPALLSITAASVGSMMPAGATVTLDTATPGLAVVTFSSPSDLPAGSHVLVNLQAGVPAENAGANYNRNQLLDIHSVTVTDASASPVPVVVDDALHLVTYFGDVSANGRINATDASLVARVAALSDNGFVGSPLVDPLLVGDISGNGRLNALDASLVAQFAALLPVPQLPPIPAVLLATNIAAPFGPPWVPTAAVNENLSAASPARNGDPYTAGWLSAADFHVYLASDPGPDPAAAISEGVEVDIDQLLTDVAEWPYWVSVDQALGELFR